VFHTIFLTTSTQYARTVGLLAAALIATQLLLILWGRSTDASVSVFAVASAICLAVASFAHKSLPLRHRLRITTERRSGE